MISICDVVLMGVLIGVDAERLTEKQPEALQPLPNQQRDGQDKQPNRIQIQGCTRMQIRLAKHVCMRIIVLT